MRVMLLAAGRSLRMLGRQRTHVLCRASGDGNVQAAGDVLLEQNRALVAAKNAEIRRAKNVLLTEAIQGLEKKLKKGKGVNKAIIAERQSKVRRELRVAGAKRGRSKGGRSCVRAPSGPEQRRRRA